MKPSIPFTVPSRYQQLFAQRYARLTPYANKSLIFAADHKFEHGLSIPPQTFFSIAHTCNLTLASHLGLISRYALPDSPAGFVIKVNAKTPTQKIRNQDPYSTPLTDIASIQAYIEQNPTQIIGLGITIYIGSQDEEKMLAYASNIINHAHQMGLPTILWSYVRGRAIPEKDTHLFLPLAASIATSLGADFAKLQLPPLPLEKHLELLEETLKAAGSTKLLFAGGPQQGLKELFTITDILVHHLGWSGGAIGRNIFEYPISYACLIAQTMTKLIAGEIEVEEALAKATEQNR